MKIVLLALDREAARAEKTLRVRYPQAEIEILPLARIESGGAWQLADATIQLLILQPGVFLVGIESVLVQHFIGTGLPATIPGFWLITLAINLGLNLVLVPRLGARGAAVTSTLSYALIFGLVAIYFCMKTGRRPAETFLLSRSELRHLFALSRRAIFSRSN